MKVTLLGDTFEAAGSEESVRLDYRDWLQAKQAVAIAKGPAVVGQGPGAEVGMVQEISSEGISRIFKDEGDFVSLNLRPKSGPADELLLLLWGFQVVKGLSSVFAPTLMKAASKSGVNTDRVDRVIKDRYIMTGGRKRGKRYSLNNEGTNAAKRLAATLLA